MLDKSVPYQDICMIKLDGALSAPVLPEGYSFRLYEAGDEKHWATIETSVDEFESTDHALAYFDREFAPNAAEMKRRCTFVCDSTGLPAATATAWWSVAGDKRFGLIHWVAVTPRCQGLGLGKAVTQRAMQLLAQCESGRPAMLHTQTWSHIAVRMYHALGFRVVKDVSPLCPKNDYQSAVSVLQSVMDEAALRRLTETAVEAAALFS